MSNTITNELDRTTYTGKRVSKGQKEELVIKVSNNVSSSGVSVIIVRGLRRHNRGNCDVIVRELWRHNRGNCNVIVKGIVTS